MPLRTVRPHSRSGPASIVRRQAGVVFWPDCVHGPAVFDLVPSLVREAVSDEQFAPRRCGRRLVCPLAECEQVALLTAIVPIHGLRDLLWFREQPYDEFETTRLFDGQVARLGAPQYLVNVQSGASSQVRTVARASLVGRSTNRVIHRLRIAWGGCCTAGFQLA
jgi:hypothetical protein